MFMRKRPRRRMRRNPIGQSAEYDAPAVIQRESKVRVDLFMTDHENLMKPRYDPDSGNLEPSLTPFANMSLRLFPDLFLFCGHLANSLLRLVGTIVS